jgi:hypothetical protein
MVMMMAVPAFADGENGQESTTASATNVWDESKESGSASQDVTASYTDTADEVVHTYYATITWDVPSFTYNFQGTTYKWNTSTMNYEKVEGGATGKAGWVGVDADGKTATYNESQSEKVTLKVTNKSDMAITCSATATKNTDQATELSVTYNQSGTAEAAITLGNGVAAKDKTTANSGEARECDLSGMITVSGVPNRDETTLATITVTLSKPSSSN